MSYLDEVSFKTIRNQMNRLLDNREPFRTICFVEHFTEVVFLFVMMQRTDIKFTLTLQRNISQFSLSFCILPTFIPRRMYKNKFNFTKKTF